jgi:hypothetical protein
MDPILGKEEEEDNLVIYRVIKKSHNPFLTCPICRKINYTEIRKQKTMLY